MHQRFVHQAGFAVMCLSITAASFAQPSLPDREPGLWEVTLKQGSSMAAMLEGMQETLAQMPEAQRKQMEQMMAQSGASFSQPNVLRQCLTAEAAKGEFKPTVDDAGMQCSEVDWHGSRTEGRYSMNCTNADGEWKIDGRIWDATSKSYKSEMTLHGVVDNQPVSIEMSQAARWVGADCQGIQPLQ